MCNLCLLRHNLNPVFFVGFTRVPSFSHHSHHRRHPYRHSRPPPPILSLSHTEGVVCAITNTTTSLLASSSHPLSHTQGVVCVKMTLDAVAALKTRVVRAGLAANHSDVSVVVCGEVRTAVSGDCCVVVGVYAFGVCVCARARARACV